MHVGGERGRESVSFFLEISHHPPVIMSITGLREPHDYRSSRTPRIPHMQPLRAQPYPKRPPKYHPSPTCSGPPSLAALGQMPSSATEMYELTRVTLMQDSGSKPSLFGHLSGWVGGWVNGVDGWASE